MRVDQIYGFAMVLIGVGLTGYAGRAVRHLTARFTATAVDVPEGSGSPVLVREGADQHEGLRLAVEEPPVLVRVGDRLVVRHQVEGASGMVTRYRPDQVGMALGFIGVGVLLVLTGVLVAVTGRAETMFAGDDQSDAAFVVVVLVAGLSAAVYEVAMLAQLLSRRRGSRVVAGRVIKIRVGVGDRSAYRPLLEYDEEPGPRRVWGLPSSVRPAVGDTVRVRIAGTPPYESVRPNRLDLVILIVLGLAGLAGIAVLGRILDTVIAVG